MKDAERQHMTDFPSRIFQKLSWTIVISSVFVLAAHADSKTFQEACNRTVSVSWDGVPLGGALRDLSTPSLPIVVDRRVDPTQLLQLSSRIGTVKEILSMVAEKTGEDLSIAESAFYLGPPQSSRILRTIMSRREEDLALAARGKNARLASRWRERHTIEWDDLATPNEILSMIAKASDLKIEGELPHDHWRRNRLPDISPITALSLIAIQWDRTFSLDLERGLARLRPVTKEDVVIERTLPRTVPPTRREALKEQFPEVEVRGQGKETLIVGRVEEIEAFLKEAARSGNPAGRPKNGGTKRPGLDPIPKRKITFAAKDVPLQAILESFNASGLAVLYEEEAFESAGIDLTQHVTVDVKEVSAKVLFAKLLGDLPIDVEITNENVVLTPKDR